MTRMQLMCILGKSRPHPASLSLATPMQQIKVFVADIPRLTMQERMKGLCMQSQNTSKDVVAEAEFLRGSYHQRTTYPILRL